MQIGVCYFCRFPNCLSFFKTRETWILTGHWMSAKGELPHFEQLSSLIVKGRRIESRQTMYLPKRPAVAQRYCPLSSDFWLITNRCHKSLVCRYTDITANMWEYLYIGTDSVKKWKDNWFHFTRWSAVSGISDKNMIC